LSRDDSLFNHPLVIRPSVTDQALEIAGNFTRLHERWQHRDLHLVAVTVGFNQPAGTVTNYLHHQGTVTVTNHHLYITITITKHHPYVTITSHISHVTVTTHQPYATDTNHTIHVTNNHHLYVTVTNHHIYVSTTGPTNTVTTNHDPCSSYRC
jgi:hypothetical protein